MVRDEDPKKRVKAYDPFATFYCSMWVVTKNGSVLTARWTGPDGFQRTTSATFHAAGEFNFIMNLPPPDGAWKMGTYTLRLSIGGNPEQEVRFEVGATPQ